MANLIGLHDLHIRDGSGHAHGKPAPEFFVRRLFIMIEQSIMSGSQWAVFEPNDQTLWKKLTRDVRAYLMRVWRSGALFGQTPEEAFYVKCDSETNPRYLIDAGQVNVQIGICPVKPAEFVVFSIGQWDGGALIEET